LLHESVRVLVRKRPADAGAKSSAA